LAHGVLKGGEFLAKTKDKRIQDEMSEKIIETAQRLATENGAERLTVRKILTALSITGRVFYNRFHDVDEVLSIAYRNTAKKIREGISVTLDPNKDLFDQVTDIVCYQGKLFALSSPLAKISGNTAHGTGCTLSAAMAANFALEKSWQDVLISAKAFVYGALAESIQLTGTLFQMYPPEQDYCAEITLNEL
jgi:hydroxymethylpyrimidine/phosphomethylpyrimidine kinase